MFFLSWYFSDYCVLRLGQCLQQADCTSLLTQEAAADCDPRLKHAMFAAKVCCVCRRYDSGSLCLYVVWLSPHRPFLQGSAACVKVDECLTQTLETEGQSAASQAFLQAGDFLPCLSSDTLHNLLEVLPFTVEQSRQLLRRPLAKLIITNAEVGTRFGRL